MRILTGNDKKKKMQYIIASIVAIVILFMWVSLPLLNKSSWDTTVSNSYGMAKKSADLSLLDSAGVDAPGQPLTGAMIDNPATTLDLEASTLFKMPETEVKYEENSENKESSSSSVDSNVSAPNVSVPSTDSSFTTAKLNKLPSISGGNSGSMTIGSTHDKFFGQTNSKAELVPLNENSKDIKSDKTNFALSALKQAEKSSLMAANSKNPDSQRGAATSAFEKTQKIDETYLNSKEEKEFARGGLEFAKAESDLKKNDPSVSKKKVSLPSPSKDEDESKKMEEQIKQMLLQMVIQATIGQVFGAMGQMMAMQMCPECYKKPASN
jgi:hypothetical protein